MNANQGAVIVGMGEMGGVFARALLRSGIPVIPVVRDAPIDKVGKDVPDPVLALVTVGEADLDNTLAGLPTAWRSRSGLVQNELLPHNWEEHGIKDPTVAAVWFEKKPGRDVKVIIPTPIAGPAAKLLVNALGGIGIAAREVSTHDQMLFELVRKNMYILTANIGGLVTKGTVHDLWYENRDLATTVAAEVLEIQAFLAQTDLDGDALVAGMVEAFDGDPDHGATGRSAPTRLARALFHADQAGLGVPALRQIAASLE